MMDASELKEKQRKHSMWLLDEPGGMRADLRGASGDFVTGYLGKQLAIRALNRMETKG